MLISDEKREYSSTCNCSTEIFPIRRKIVCFSSTQIFFFQPARIKLIVMALDESIAPSFPKDLGKDIAREDVEEGDVEEDIDQENENTCSLVSKVTKWEKMRQAGQKLSESALTPETLKSYEK